MEPGGPPARAAGHRPPGETARRFRSVLTAAAVCALPVVLIAATWGAFPSTPSEYREGAPRFNLYGTPLAEGETGRGRAERPRATPIGRPAPTRRAVPTKRAAAERRTAAAKRATPEERAGPGRREQRERQEQRRERAAEGRSGEDDGRND